MATKTYVDFTTPVVDAEWLNEVDAVIYENAGTLDVIAAGATVTETLGALVGAPIYRVEGAGAVGDGVTDDSGAIQAAIDAAEANGGGVVLFDAKIYAIATGLVVDENNVRLLGKGEGNFQSGGIADIRATAATTLKWIGLTGSGTMVKFTTDTGDTGTKLTRVCGGIEGIFIDQDEKALVGLEMQTWQRARWRNVHVAWAATGGYGYKIWTLPNGVVAGADDNQHNEFTDLAYSEVNTVSTPLAGMIIGKGGSSGGNTSLNYFHNTRIKMQVDATPSLVIENADTNYFYFTSGGENMILHADDTGALSTSSWARFNHFFGINAVVTAKATVAGTNSSAFNSMWGLSRGSGAPKPAIEAGAHLFYAQTSDGNVTNQDEGASLFGRQKRGVFLRRAANQSINSGVTTSVSWDTEEYDTDDAATVTGTDITVPNGVFACRISFQVRWGTGGVLSTRRARVLIDTGGGFGNFNGAPDNQVVSTNQNVTNNGSTGEIAVNAGDVFQLSLFQDSTATLSVLGGFHTWIKIEWL